jgi:hypothetical protein
LLYDVFIVGRTKRLNVEPMTYERAVDFAYEQMLELEKDTEVVGVDGSHLLTWRVNR